VDGICQLCHGHDRSSWLIGFAEPRCLVTSASYLYVEQGMAKSTRRTNFFFIMARLAPPPPPMGAAGWGSKAEPIARRVSVLAGENMPSVSV
jgi:hypothetical protein